MSKRIILFAPGVHTGGGLTLLRALLRAWPTQLSLFAWLDYRAQALVRLPFQSTVRWVKPSVLARLAAEIQLSKQAESGDTVICFHGIPPIFHNDATINVFLQNRLLIDRSSTLEYSAKGRVRLCVNRFLFDALCERVSVFFVQTPSMEVLLQRRFGANSHRIHVTPFVGLITEKFGDERRQWDFVFVADGQPYKNHKRLVEAWIMLKRWGLRPSLVLTLSDRDSELRNWVNRQVEHYDLDITDLGQVDNVTMHRIYSSVGALIFPSLVESFALPLVEARIKGLPIVAGELDYVRDVCVPVQSFNPLSAVSMARAVRRFLDCDDCPIELFTAEQFLGAVIGHNGNS